MHSAHTIILAREKAFELLNKAIVQIGEGRIREDYDSYEGLIQFYADIPLPLQPHEKHFTERIAVLECMIELTDGTITKARLEAKEINFFSNLTMRTPEAERIERASRAFTKCPVGRKRVINFRKFVYKSGSSMSGAKLIRAIIHERQS